MHELLTVDPGIHGSGCALWTGDTLAYAEYVKSRGKEEARPEQRVRAMAEAICACFEDWKELVTERPRIYFDKRINPDALLPLAEIGAFLAGRFGRSWMAYRPHEWKGSLDGLAMTVRIRERLSDEEFSRIVFPQNSCEKCRSKVVDVADEKICLKSRSCLAHNVYDAVGIGLHHLGRLERKRNIAR